MSLEATRGLWILGTEWDGRHPLLDRCVFIMCRAWRFAEPNSVNTSCRPTIHAALLRPRIAGAFGTEFNPALYKQSMLALSEVRLKTCS